jgi:F0F1-type ATP synthase membrane subunit c/vacuolar-type H+-ATPase subunit K
MRTMIGALLLVGLVAWGGYYIVWAYQSASFSVAAEPVMKSMYETRAMLALPVGVALIVIGVVLFLVLRKPPR